MIIVLVSLWDKANSLSYSIRVQTLEEELERSVAATVELAGLKLAHSQLLTRFEELNRELALQSQRLTQERDEVRALLMANKVRLQQALKEIQAKEEAIALVENQLSSIATACSRWVICDKRELDGNGMAQFKS